MGAVAGAEIATADGRALGGSLRVAVTRPAQLRTGLAAVESVLSAIDSACSRFRPDSELSEVNALAGRQVEVSRLLATFLEAALRAAKLSNGALDPTVGRAVKVVGYDMDFASVARTGEAIPLRVVPIPGWQSIRFDSRRRTLVVPAGVELDLGATGKALAADLAAEAVLESAAGGVLVSLGGDIALRGEAPAGGWRIQVGEDSGEPLRDDAEAITLSSGGIATSSTMVRRWTRGGVALHHIVDPVTGLPAEGPWRTVSVIAATCLDANIAATSSIVLGEKAVEWLEEASLPARLVDRAGAVTRIGGWPAPVSPGSK